MHEASAAVDEVMRLYRDGLYLQAFQVAEQLGPLTSWRGPARRVLAGRLAGALGSYRLAYALHLRAHREDPADMLAAYYACRATMHRRGSWTAWQAAKAVRSARIDDVELAGDWLMLQGLLASLWRDFEQANELATKALELAPQRAWLHVEHSYILQGEDRVEDARAAAARSLELKPWFRPGIQALAHARQVAGEVDSATTLLQEAVKHIECGDLRLQLADLQIEREDFAGAMQSIDAAEKMLPLLDKARQVEFAARRSEVAYRLGDEATAIAAAEQVGPGYYECVAKNLKAAGPESRRVVLPVPFVRQHHMTCAPATLTSICRYWDRPADHLQIAESICFDGTPAHSERGWAERSGFHAREFTVDWETATALIDRGVPFTFTTVEVTCAHLQAVAGYDARRGTLVMRDPSFPRLTEMLGREGLEHYRGHGPRGMILVPLGKEKRIEGLRLPDAELYDEFYQAQKALESHRRAEAQAAVDRMRALDGEHRLTLAARRMLAAYDADPVSSWRVSEEWSMQYPDNAPLLFARLNAMRSVAPRSERLAFLSEVCLGPGRDPVFRLNLAEELLDDARSHSEARRLLVGLVRQRPQEARCYFALAGLAWAGQSFAEALELYRIAACLEERREFYAQRYFAAAREMGQAEIALDWLADRARRFQKKNSEPAQTCFWALNLLDRTDEAFAVLEAALAERPDDGELLLYAADACGRCGKFDQASHALQQCREITHEVAWLRTAAGLARYRGDLRESLGFWTQVANRDPQSVDAAAAIAELRALTESRAAALAGLKKTLDTFPNNVALLRTAVEWWREDEVEVEQVVTRLLDHNPVEPWARRELAISLSRQQRHAEGIREAELAITLDPADSWGHSVLAGIHRKAGNLQLAADCYRRALELDVDNDSAAFGLIETCDTHADRVCSLAFLYDQLVAQTTLGDGLLNYYFAARRVLPADQVLQNLQAGLGARPDLWHAWSAVVRQLLDMQRADEALSVADGATARFPLLPACWLDLAVARQDVGDDDGELAALDKCVSINGNWPQAIFRLLEAHTRRGEFRQAKEVAERAVVRMPLEAVLHGYLADLCWRMNLRGQAMLELRRSVEIDPGYAWGWESLDARGAENQQPDAALRAARELVNRQPGDSRGWYWLARLQSPGEIEGQLDAVRKAIELSPDWVDAHKLLSEILATVGRFDEALAACRPAYLATRQPLELQMQEATLLYAQGRSDEAIAALREVVSQNPDYAAGWERLAAWYAPLEAQREGFLEAAERLVGLSPGSSSSWSCLGDARLAQGDRVAARKAFSRALELAPEFQYAGLMLFDLQADDRDWPAAQDTLATLERHVGDAWVWARFVRQKLALRDQAAAIAYFEKLCATPCQGDWPLAFALEQMRGAGLRGKAERIVKRFALTQPDSYALSEYVGLQMRWRMWGNAIRWLNRAADDSFAWRQAAGRLMTAWPAEKHKWKLRRFIRRHQASLRNDTHLWGLAGFAYFKTGQYKSAIHWLADWQSRSGVEPWMLSNLVLALCEVGREAQIRPICEYALTLEIPQGIEDHRAMLAAWHAQFGDLEEARKHLEVIATSSLDQLHTVLRRIANATVSTADELRHTSLRGSWWGVYRRFARKTGGPREQGYRLCQRLRVTALRRLLRETGHTQAARLPFTFFMM